MRISPSAMRLSEANRTDDLASFILHHVRTLHALQRGFRVLVTKRGGLLIPYSDKTHGHFTHYYAEVWKPYLASFMETLGPVAAAR